jgi:hypothetical protein
MSEEGYPVISTDTEEGSSIPLDQKSEYSDDDEYDDDDDEVTGWQFLFSFLGFGLFIAWVTCMILITVNSFKINSYSEKILKILEDVDVIDHERIKELAENSKNLSAGTRIMSIICGAGPIATLIITMIVLAIL